LTCDFAEVFEELKSWPAFDVALSLGGHPLTVGGVGGALVVEWRTGFSAES
jgi:hypothetical protein